MKSNEKKTGNKKKWIIGIAIIVVIGIAFSGEDSKKDSSSVSVSSKITDTPKPKAPEKSDDQEESIDDMTEKSYTLEFGELLEQNINELNAGKVLVIKAKITSSYDNEATIHQNYYNVEDLIKKQGCSEFDQIQYWAVADMSDGSETKVVSFTLESDLIQSIADGKIPANQIGDYVADLYVHQSLQ